MCPRVCHDKVPRNDFKVLGVKKATTDEGEKERTLSAKSVFKYTIHSMDIPITTTNYLS